METTYKESYDQLKSMTDNALQELEESGIEITSLRKEMQENIDELFDEIKDIEDRFDHGERIILDTIKNYSDHIKKSFVLKGLEDSTLPATKIEQLTLLIRNKNSRSPLEEENKITNQLVSLLHDEQKPFEELYTQSKDIITENLGKIAN